jgi:hypothetical protein
LYRPAGALLVLVAIQVFVLGLYLPPELKKVLPLDPPQITISPPLQTAVCCDRAEGALLVLVTVQPSVLGL